LIVLAGDIGGTKALLRIDRWADGRRQPIAEQLYRCERYRDLSEIIEDFLRGKEAKVDAACLAVAGPIVDATVKLTNLPWKISARAIESSFDIRSVELINDFEAVGWGIQVISPQMLVALQKGRRQEDGVQAVLGAGTGLGICFVGTAGDAVRVYASEGGHISFAPNNEEEIKLLEHLRRRYGRVSVERVLSGPGLVNIFEFLNEARPACAELLQALEKGEGPAAITEFALTGRDPVAARALDIFVSVYGACAGDLALLTLATGGVFVAGGIAPKIEQKLREGAFMRAFYEKGRYTDLLKTVPVYVVLDEKVGLLGASLVASRRVEER
jgi:glucokinase